MLINISGRPAVTFGFRVALPAVLVLVASILAGLVILDDMAEQVDRIDMRSSERSVSAAAASYLTRLRETHGDYAVWDDAAEKLYGNVDMEFVASNLREASRLATLFDTAYLLDENDAFVLGYVRGQPVMRPAAAEFGRPLEVLIRAVRDRSGPFDAATGYLRTRSGVILAVAVGSILPSTPGVARPERTRLLLLGRPLDGAALERLSNEFLLENLELLPATPVGRDGVELYDPAGMPLGALTWNPAGEGRQAFDRIAPTAYLTAGLIGVTMFFLLAIGYTNLIKIRNRELEAIRIANHDGLTGLPNRSALARRLEMAIEAGRAAGAPVALIYLDLDGFKEVNDGYGHEAGDALLRHVAAGFASICEGSGFLARVGGDEFAIVLDNREMVERAEAISERLVHFFDDPIDLGGRVISMGTSVGVAVLEAEPADARELLRRADVAMYMAKEYGRNRVALYDSSMDRARAERMRLADDLREALRNDRLAVVYQPIFEAKTLRPVGAEALLRWLHPTVGLVPPDIFVPIAEEIGLIERIGAWVMRQALRDAREWEGVRLSVNVSPAQFRNPGFDRFIADALEEAGFDASRLEIEMTETHLVSFPERAHSILAGLRRIGVTVALDDFGTGYSSIGYLRRFTFDKLKLDRSLVLGITSDEPARRLCEATIALGRALDLEVTAEGVETEAEAAVLRNAGCDYLQGYAFSRPMTAEATSRFLEATLARNAAPPQGASET